MDVSDLDYQWRREVPVTRVLMPEMPANIAWGDADWKVLFLTARSSIYRIRFSIPGMPVGSYRQYLQFVNQK